MRAEMEQARRVPAPAYSCGELEWIWARINLCTRVDCRATTTLWSSGSCGYVVCVCFERAGRWTRRASITRRPSRRVPRVAIPFLFLPPLFPPTRAGRWIRDVSITRSLETGSRESNPFPLPVCAPLVKAARATMSLTCSATENRRWIPFRGTERTCMAAPWCRAVTSLLMNIPFPPLPLQRDGRDDYNHLYC